jgi:hypothetical protein
MLEISRFDRLWEKDDGSKLEDRNVILKLDILDKGSFEDS